MDKWTKEYLEIKKSFEIKKTEFEKLDKQMAKFTNIFLKEIDIKKLGINDLYEQLEIKLQLIMMKDFPDISNAWDISFNFNLSKKEREQKNLGISAALAITQLQRSYIYYTEILEKEKGIENLTWEEGILRDKKKKKKYD